MKFSVAMCTYNGERFVESQIASIIDQTVLPSELVVCDDRSNDETIAIVERMAMTAPFPIRITINDVRLGSTANFAGAIAACSGDVVALADQDDVWVPEKLAVIEEALAADPGLLAVFSDADVVDEVLLPLGFSMFDYLGFGDAQKEQIRRDDAFDLVLRWSFVTGAALAFRSSLKPHVLPIPTGIPLMLHDKWIGILAVAIGRLGLIDEKLIRYRQHSGQQIGTPSVAGPAWTRFQEMNVRDFTTESEYLAYLRELAACVHSNAAGAIRPRFQRALDSKITHLEVRSRLPRNSASCMVAVAREVLSGRYAQHSRGLRSAVKDVLGR